MYGHAIEFVNPWERQMLSLFMDEHRGCSKDKPKRNNKAIPMHMQCKARKEDLVACQV
jgi:hypothetical protein